MFCNFCENFENSKWPPFWARQNFLENWDNYSAEIRLVIYYSQSITITITFENIQSITITITFQNFKSITITITLASITSITFYYILLQFGANLRGNFNTEIKLTGYFIHLILLKMLQIMPYKDKISQIYHLVYLQLNK